MLATWQKIEKCLVVTGKEIRAIMLHVYGEFIVASTGDICIMTLLKVASFHNSPTVLVKAATLYHPQSKSFPACATAASFLLVQNAGLGVE